MRVVLGERGHDQVEIPVAAVNQLRRDLLSGVSPADIARRLAWFELEPLERPLDRLAQHATAVAARLGKGDLAIDVETDGARVDSRRFASLWGSLVHVVRNAVDHGIEAPSDRIARGKTPAGRVSLRAAQTGLALTIEIEDEGAGIDWDAVGELAAARGLPHATSADLLGAILADGFTTRSDATLTSGRGVGMAAVAQAVTSLGGTLSVRSRRGAGTCWRAVLPLEADGRAPAARGPEPTSSPSPGDDRLVLDGARP